MPRCQYCSNLYKPSRAMQPGRVCNDIECQSKWAIDRVSKQRSARDKSDRKTTKAKLEKLKPLSYWADKAQKAVNAYIRARDAGEPCISCCRHHQGKVNAGHYRSRGAMPALRFHPDNIHLQCEPCNSNLAGNVLEYRKRLIEKIGIERVEWLDGPHETPKWKKEDYQQIEADAKAMLKCLSNKLQGE